MATILNPRKNRMPEFGLNPGAVSNGMVYAGGMALDFDTMYRRADADTIANETRLCLEEIVEIVEAAGGSKRDIFKTTCYLSDEAHRGEFIKAYKEFFEPGPFPARCTFVVGIAAGCRVEIDSIAELPKDKK
jgi:2-iminobutanoate/2-iminopropanoate deaminase